VKTSMRLSMQSMAFATSLWRESLQRPCFIQSMRSLISGAISSRRVVTRASGDEGSSAKKASNLRTASKAICEIVLGPQLRAFEATSASSNSLRRAMMRHCRHRQLDPLARIMFALTVERLVIGILLDFSRWLRSDLESHTVNLTTTVETIAKRLDDPNTRYHGSPPPNSP
jgi:hypothetical protein